MKLTKKIEKKMLKNVLKRSLWSQSRAVTPESVSECARQVGALGDTMRGQDYLQTWQLSDAQLRAVIYAARGLEQLHREGVACDVFASGLAVSNFRDKSTRTRAAWASAASFVGLDLFDFDEAKSQVAHNETTRETASMLSFLTQAIGIRDDLILDEGCRYQREVADAVTESAQSGVLAQRPCVVNLQCDRDHPTQSMADLMHLADLAGGSLDNVRKKRVAVTWAHSSSYGKPLSVPQGLVGLLPRFGVDVVLAHPEGYELLPEVIENARVFAEQSGGSFEIADSMESAFAHADVVYPKSWAPMNIMERRRDMYRQHASTSDVLAALEADCIAQNAEHKHWTCTEDMMALTRVHADGSAKAEADYMHCLPADITGVNAEHGEVEESVFARHRLATYSEASHKPFVCAAAILLSHFGANALHKILEFAK
jgi:knotted carbamoyltransferase YgeW